MYAHVFKIFECKGNVPHSLIVLQLVYIHAIVKMSFEHSLLAFIRHKRLFLLENEDLKYFTKQFLIEHAPEDIGAVWHRLPKQLTGDKEMHGFQWCNGHPEIKHLRTHIDGPLMRSKCTHCINIDQ